MSNEAIVLDQPQQIAAFRLGVLRIGLAAEIQGRRLTRGRTCYAILKGMGYTGSRQSVLAQLLRERGQ